MGLDLQNLTKSLHGLTELKMTLQSIYLFYFTVYLFMLYCSKSAIKFNIH